MKIVEVQAFEVHHTSVMFRDSEGHSHPGKKPHDAAEPILKIVCDDGTVGYAVGSRPNVPLLNKLIAPALIGEDPLFREKIWQKMRTWQRLHSEFTDKTLSAIDIALWDICGKKAGLPIYKLLGAYRDTVPAYASIMVGDDFPGGLDTPQAYADYAVKLVQRGYKAIKMHTWMPPIIPVPDPKKDISACRAVREAVGPDIELMLDSYHDYSRQDALYLGRELEKLGYLWLEEPMDESSIESYAWLSSQLDIQVCGPETALGKHKVRAEWISARAADIGRIGDHDVGGITPLMKCIGLYESHGLTVELHGGTLGNLQVLGAMGIQGKYYERGLLHPFLDYEKPKPWFNTLYDPMDGNGDVTIPQTPGMGWDLNFDYINDNIIKR